MSGFAVFIFGGAALVLSPWIGELLYKNVSRLPGVVADKIYVDIYPLEEYSEQFFQWAIWPAGFFMAVGLLGVTYFFLPSHSRGALYLRRWPIGFGVAALLGIGIRTRAYFQDRSMWLDEAFLALNIRERSFGELLASPLDYGQSAPPGFLFLVFLSVSLFGVSDMTLRLVPFIFGLAVVGVSVPLAFRLFISNLARMIFVVFLSLSPVLIYYSHEFKQYSLDAFITLMVLWAWAHRERWKGSLCLGLVGFFGVLLSLPAVFSLTALGVAMVVKATYQGNGWRLTFQKIFSDWPAYSLWLVGGLVHLWYLSVGGTDRENRGIWWRQNGGFPPTGNLIDSVNWVLSSLSQLVWLAVGHPGRAGPGMGDGITSLALLFFAGLVIASRKNLSKLIFPIILILVALTVAFIGIYPFSSRLNIYLVPVVILSLALLAEKDKHKRGLNSSLLLGIPAVASLIPLAIGFYLLGKPFDNWDTKWLIEEVVAAASPGDIFVGAEEPLTSWYLPDGAPEGLLLVKPGVIAEGLGSPPASQVWVISTHEGIERVGQTISRTHELICSYEISGSSLALYAPQSSSVAFDFDCRPQAKKF